MTRQHRITVSGKPRVDIDALVLLQVLLAIGEEWDHPDDGLASSPDAFDAAIEDHGLAAEGRR